MNHIYIIIGIILLLVFFYFLFMRKNNKIKKIIKIKEEKVGKKKDYEIIPLPIYAYDSEKNLVYVGDINDLEKRDNRDIIDFKNIKEDEVYFNTQDGKLEYKGKIEDLKPNQTKFPSAKDYFYLLSNYTDEKNGVNCYIIYVTKKEK
jgi:hypothetical protein